MTRNSLTIAKTSVLAALTCIGFAACSGSDGAPGADGRDRTIIDASTASAEQLAALDVVSEIHGISIASPPVIEFSMTTAEGLPIVGLKKFWDDSNRFIRFTLTKLVPGQNGDPDSWVAYVRDGTSGEPDYDTGASLEDYGNGRYSFTFDTDVTNVSGVPYEPTLTHRVAGQIGAYRTVPLMEQNVWLDFVPAGGAVTRTRSVASMASCNECHDNLVFHGRRFKAEYCVQCHNPDLAQGEGDYSFMIHRIHNAGDFKVLDGAKSYADVTYPQGVSNCRKCHNAEDTDTPQADNWRTLPSISSCGGCHDVFENNAALHSGGELTDNSRCTECHDADKIVGYHTTANATPNNPELPEGQRDISYEMVDAAVDGTTNVVTVRFKVLSGATALDVTNLPADMKDGAGDVFRYAGLLLAYALPQDGITAPADYNNLGRAGGQPISLGLDDFAPINTSSPIGTLSFNTGDGVMTATITDTASQFPTGATLRAVSLQGYFRQDLDNDGNYDASLHAPSAVVAVTGDTKRREIVDSAKCAQCHEWFEGHGGNRVISADSAINCSLCHVPNLSSSGRTIDLLHPEDAQSLKDMIHGIHSSGFRTRAYKHVRNFRNNANVYDWSHVTFPRNASTSKCTLCHNEGTYELPLPTGVLPTTVRTTGRNDGQDATVNDASTARSSLPNATDWVNSPTASSCFYCHTSVPAWAHMMSNGGLLSVPQVGLSSMTNRSGLIGFESCQVCHGPGKKASVKAVHNR